MAISSDAITNKNVKKCKIYELKILLEIPGIELRIELKTITHLLVMLSLSKKDFLYYN